MRNLPLFIAIAALGAGCTQGSVTSPPGVEDFGSVRSGVWLVVTQTADGEVEVGHSLVLSTERGFCGKAQKAYPQVAEVFDEASTGYSEVYQDIYERYYGTSDYDALYTALNRAMCSLYLDAFSDLGDATRPLMDKTNTLALDMARDTEDGWTDVPLPGTYRTWDHEDGDGEHWFGGSLTYADENPYDIIAGALKDADCDNLGPEDSWYDLWYDEYDEIAPLDIDRGTLELEAKGEEAFTATVTGDIGEARGFEATGTFKRCDVSVEGHAYLPF